MCVRAVLGFFIIFCSWAVCAYCRSLSPPPLLDRTLPPGCFSSPTDLNRPFSNVAQLISDRLGYFFYFSLNCFFFRFVWRELFWLEPNCVSAEKKLKNSWLIESIRRDKDFWSVKLSCPNCISNAQKIHSVIVKKRLTDQQCCSSRRRSAEQIETRTSRWTRKNKRERRRERSSQR